jgi:dTDP-4-dehydrorhamnose 3,5-epimerase-like enzyme|tara:strand:+ start:458 stop:883 length:426 start_codon:yes stop_codon:yes gene_type:complete
MQNKPTLIEGGFFEDERGRLDFVNDFDVSEIKRMYFTTNNEVGFFRGWQGHKIESRWFQCIKGKFEISLIKIDNWENPSDNLLEETFVLEASSPKVIYIPAGYVNGFSSLEDNSKLMILSNFKLGENSNDDIRYESDKWKK